MGSAVVHRIPGIHYVWFSNRTFAFFACCAYGTYLWHCCCCCCCCCDTLSCGWLGALQRGRVCVPFFRRGFRLKIITRKLQIVASGDSDEFVRRPQWTMHTASCFPALVRFLGWPGRMLKKRNLRTVHFLPIASVYTCRFDIRTTWYIFVSISRALCRFVCTHCLCVCPRWTRSRSRVLKFMIWYSFGNFPRNSWHVPLYTEI